MNEVILDGARIGTESEFHKVISELLSFVPYYGSNLDALRDRLTNDVERTVRIIWGGV
jgi:ribonuclease inhibitor